MSVIYLRDLVVQGRHGVTAKEKAKAQPFRISVEIELDSAAAQASDQLEHSVDYSAVRRTIISTVKHTSFNLLEHLAQTLADRLMIDDRIKKLDITIEKPKVFDSGVPGIRLTLSR